MARITRCLRPVGAVSTPTVPYAVLRIYRQVVCTTLGIILLFVLPAPAMATQGHGGIEGVYAHQMAHLFFIFSMGVLIYWLRDHKLTAISGWRYIQYAALFFILWNADTFLVHYVEEQLDLLQIDRRSPWLLEIRSPAEYGWLSTLYYIIKLDHLLCVPALVFLYLGLKRLLAKNTTASGSDAS